VKIRAQAAAAYDFTHTLHGVADQAERKKSTESVARKLLQEFPGEPQAYQALLAVAKASDQPKSEQLTRELIAAQTAPDEVKASAQVILDRFGLMGQSLVAVLADDKEGVGAVLPAKQPVILYSWATWGPGSIELGRMIQARRFAAVGVCLDEDTKQAVKTANALGLGGKHFYDPDGWRGKLATRLKFSTAGQIYLVDADGIIRDVRGGDDLEAKLKALGFSTPPLVVPSISELVRP
jgi:hypothetical protein